ncbi:hypothetical protein BGZ81_007973 [Podila clonocystis]|nr:hypothetical protein BGZ81_007973 [Podila clonocystis]
MRLLTLLGTAASVLATVSASIAYAYFAADENLHPPGSFKRCQACGDMEHKREGQRNEYPAWIDCDTNTVLDGATRSKHHSGPHNEYDVDEANKIITTLPYSRSKWILPIGAHYKRVAVDEHDEEIEASK